MTFGRFWQPRARLWQLPYHQSAARSCRDLGRFLSPLGRPGMSASFTLTVPTAALPAVQACLEELARQIRAHENSAPLEAPVLAAAERAAVLTSSTVQSNRNSEVEPIR